MTEKLPQNNLQSELTLVETHLAWVRAQFATHILTKHFGLPATSCHKCINYRTGIEADKEVISMVKAEMKSSK